MTKTIEFTERGIKLPPNILDDLTRREFLVGAGLIVLAPACGSDGEGGEASRETRTFEHAMGETEIPARAENVAALGGFIFDSAAALGVPMAGVSTFEGYDYLQEAREEYDEARRLGSWDRPDIESVALVEPDLIIGELYTAEETYEELSQIAPTVVLPDYETPYDWKRYLRFVAGAAGREERARQVLADYESRIERLRDALGTALEETEVSVVRAYPDSISIYLEGSLCGGVLRDVGLPRPASQRGEDNAIEISLEELEQADGDVIFLWSFSPGQEEATRQLRERPLWQRLDAVKAGRMYEVGGHWYAAGPIGANLVLDDLEKHLLDGGSG
jgi:iron complex transport system substrate-binding protein